MAKNTVTSFGLGSRIPAKPAEESFEPEIKEEIKQAETKPVKAPVLDDDYIIDVPETEKEEYKTRRVQLVLKPSVYKKMHKYLKDRNQSFNDFMCQYLDAFIEKKGL